MTRHFFMLVAGFACGIASMCAVAATTPAMVNARPVYGPLSADQLTKIQGIGRAVLVAKQSQTANAEDAALKSDIEALQADFDKAITSTLATHPASRKLDISSIKMHNRVVTTINMTSNDYKVTRDKDGHFQSEPVVNASAVTSGKSSAVPDAMSPGVPVAGSEPYAGVRQRLDKIEAELQQYIANAQAQNRPDRTIYGQTWFDKITQLKADIDNALSNSSSGDSSQLMALRERMRAHGIETRNPDGTPVEASAPTPTLTTLTHHISAKEITK